MGTIRKHGRYLWIRYYRDGKRLEENTFSVDPVVAGNLLLEREDGVAPRARNTPQNPGIYFIRSLDTGLTKIGMSANLSKRLATLHKNLPGKLDLIAKIPAADYREAERLIHAYLADRRQNGEWFRVTVADIEDAIHYWAALTTRLTMTEEALHE